MRNALIVVSFLILVGLLNDSNQQQAARDGVSVEIGKTWITNKEGLKSVRILSDEKGPGFIIELEQFRPAWSSRAFSRLKFKAPEGSCEYFDSKPRLFNCNYNKQNGRIAKTRTATGTKIELTHLSSALFKGQTLDDSGVISQSNLYSVDIGLKIGRREHSFRVFTQPKLIESQGEKAQVPVASRPEI